MNASCYKIKKIPVSIICAILFVVVASCSTTNRTSKCIMTFENRGQILLSRTYADHGIHLTLETSDPIALRTLLMQGFQMQLYGTQTDTVVVAFLSAKDVNDKISHHPGEVKATVQGEKEKRPDMRPLVAAINAADVYVSKKGISPAPLKSNHKVMINPANGTLSYSVVIPYEIIGDGDVSVTLLSRPQTEMVGHDEFYSQGYTSRSAENRPQPFGASRNDGNAGHKKTIRVQFKFNQ